MRLAGAAGLIGTCALQEAPLAGRCRSGRMVHGVRAVRAPCRVWRRRAGGMGPRRTGAPHAAHVLGDMQGSAAHAHASVHVTRLDTPRPLGAWCGRTTANPTTTDHILPARSGKLDRTMGMRPCSRQDRQALQRVPCLPASLMTNRPTCALQGVEIGPAYANHMPGCMPQTLPRTPRPGHPPSLQLERTPHLHSGYHGSPPACSRCTRLVPASISSTAAHASTALAFSRCSSSAIAAPRASSASACRLASSRRAVACCVAQG